MTEVPETHPYVPPESRIAPVTSLRLLPWQDPDGRPAILNGDGGYVSRLADQIEEAQLGSARAVFDLAPVVLDDIGASTQEVRFAARRLRESLGDVLKLAECRRPCGAAQARKFTSPHVKRWTYNARCVGEARHELRRVLDAWGLGDLADRAELVLSELLTNAVRHTVPLPTARSRHGTNCCRPAYASRSTTPTRPGRRRRFRRRTRSAGAASPLSTR